MQTTEQEQLHGLSTADLVRHALEEARLLAKAEVLHAKEELKQELGAAKTAGILLGACATLALTALSVLFVALALALPLPPVASLAMVGVALLAIAGTCGALGYKKVPRKPMKRTQERLKNDLVLAKEQLA